MDALYSADAACSLFWHSSQEGGNRLLRDDQTRQQECRRDTQSGLAEIHNQVLMMLGHVIFDPETSRNVLVDHAFIVAGGVITKQARNWLGSKLDATKRSQIMFMDREDILNLYTVTNIPL